MNHKDLDAWKAGMDLVVAIYGLTKKFPQTEQYGLASQLQRAAVSIPSNIAEGCGRRSERETLRFLSITLGSLAEVETQILIAERLNYVDNQQQLIEQVTKIRQLVLGLMRYIDGRLTPNT